MTRLERYVRVVGVDPGLAHFGWAVANLYYDRISFVACGCIRTEKSDKKRRVKVADDNVRRARIVAVEFAKVLDKYRPTHMTSEAFSAPRSSSAASKMAISWGIMIDQIMTRRIGLSTATPQEIKKVMTGRSNASKLEVQAALFEFEGFGRIEDYLEDLLAQKPSLARGKWEHPCDAASSIVACLDSEIIIALRGQL